MPPVHLPNRVARYGRVPGMSSIRWQSSQCNYLWEENNEGDYNSLVRRYSMDQDVHSVAVYHHNRKEAAGAYKHQTDHMVHENSILYKIDTSAQSPAPYCSPRGCQCSCTRTS